MSASSYFRSKIAEVFADDWRQCAGRSCLKYRNGQVLYEILYTLSPCGRRLSWAWDPQEGMLAWRLSDRHVLSASSQRRAFSSGYNQNSIRVFSFSISMRACVSGPHVTPLHVDLDPCVSCFPKQSVTIRARHLSKISRAFQKESAFDRSIILLFFLGSYTTNQNSLLKQHVRLNHDDSKPYRCSLHSSRDVMSCM